MYSSPMVAVRSKAVILWMFTYGFLLLILCNEYVYVVSSFFGVVLGVLSSLAILLLRTREMLALFSFTVRCCCPCSVSLPHGIIGWSTICDIGIS